MKVEIVNLAAVVNVGGRWQIGIRNAPAAEQVHQGGDVGHVDHSILIHIAADDRDLSCGIGRNWGRFQVSDIIGGHAIEAVGMADLARESGGSERSVILKQRKRAAVVGNEDVVAGNAAAAGIILARPTDRERD